MSSSSPSLWRQTLADFGRVWKKISLVFLIYLCATAGTGIASNWLTSRALAQLTAQEKAPQISASIESFSIDHLDSLDLDAFQSHIQAQADATRALSNTTTGLGLLYNVLFAFFVSALISREKQSVADPLTLSAFKNYTLAILWKYLRPVLWLLIPLLGIVFYTNALLRYELVGPLALQKAKDPLQESRALTEGHVWRLIGVYSWIGLLPLICFLLIDLPFVFRAFSSFDANLFVRSWPDVAIEAAVYGFALCLSLVLPFTALDAFSPPAPLAVTPDQKTPNPFEPTPSKGL